MIQDAAVKCRYCGEWLDPSKRPPHSANWTPSGPSASNAAAAVSAAEQAPADPVHEDSSDEPANSLAADATSAEPGAETSSRWAPPPSILSGTYERGAEDSGVIPPGSARQRTPASGSLSLSAVSAELSGELGSVADAPLEDSIPASHLRLAPEPAPGQPAEEHDGARADDLSAQVPTDGPPGQDYEALVSFVAQHSGADTGAWTAEPTEEPGSSAEALAIADNSSAPQTAADAEPRGDARAKPPVSNASEPTPTRETPASAASPTSPTSALEAEFFGSGDSFGAGDSFGFGDSYEDEDYGDYGDEGDPFGGNVSAAPRRVPWTAILGGAVLVVAVFFVFAKLGEFSRGETDTPETADAKAQPGSDAKAPSKAPPPSELAKAAGEGQPVTPADAKAPDAPDAKAPDATAPDAASPDAKAPPVAPPVEDEAFKAKLAEARSLYERHKLKDAGEALEALKGAESNHPDVLLLTAQVLLERSKLDDAMTAAKRCVEVSSTQADCWLTLGVLHQNSKDTEAAIAAYEKYLNLAPSGRYVRDASSQLKRLRGK